MLYYDYYTVLTIGGIETTMATKKAATKTSTSSRTTAAKKTTTKKPAAKVAAVKTTSVRNVKAENSRLPKNLANIVLAELVGTFVLTMVALTTASFGALYVGLALVVLVLAIGAISGAHVNPAVTFGLWTMRRLKTVMVPFYWLSQFFGAMLAVAVMSLVTSGQFVMNFSNFATINWSILGIELVGAAVFMFILAAVWSRDELSAGTKAAGIGLALTIGLVAGGSMLTQLQNSAYQQYQKDASSSTTGTTSLPRALMVKGAVLNPAVALAVTESTESQLTSGVAADGEKQVSRFGLEVILGTLAGAAIGGNLYVLMTYRGRKEA